MSEANRNNRLVSIRRRIVWPLLLVLDVMLFCCTKAEWKTLRHISRYGKLPPPPPDSRDIFEQWYKRYDSRENAFLRDPGNTPIYFHSEIQRAWYYFKSGWDAANAANQARSEAE